MANVQRGYCPRCRRITGFYHVDPEFWECEECGYEVEEPDTDEMEYEDNEEADEYEEDSEENDGWEDDE